MISTSQGVDIAVAGSIAYDDVETPSGLRKDQLGGAGVFFSLAAAHFSSVGLVGVVGRDFRPEHRELLVRGGVDVEGVEQADGDTFRWRGHYMDDLNVAVTLDTRLNVFENFQPKLSAKTGAAPFVFLANIHPRIQLDTLAAMHRKPEFLACDTMDLWIRTEREGLSKLVGKTDALIINEAEAAAYTARTGIRGIADALLDEGVKCVVIKRGEYGVALFTPDFAFMLPAYPLGTVKDPTGAGDSFAGGFMGYLAQVGKLEPDDLRNATVAGSVMASFAVSEFGTDGLAALKAREIEKRFRAFGRLTRFNYLEEGARLPLREAVT